MGAYQASGVTQRLLLKSESSLFAGVACEVLVADEGCDDYGLPDAARPPESESVLAFPDPHAEFETEVVRNISFASALPELLKTLTPRERDVFACLRQDKHNCEIAEILDLSEPRVSQLVKQLRVS